MKALQLNGLVKRFGDITAVDNIDLSVQEGEIFGLLGPNGAGKSTTINMISGLINPDSGTIKLFDKDVAKNALFAKTTIGLVPQDIAIYGDLTAYENVSFFAGLYGIKGRELQQNAEEALEFVGLSEHAKRFPKGFSGGMKRRLNIACAIAHKPKLIIMDEPTVGIDPQSRNHILQSVKELNKRGSTIIYTSHYMEEVEEVCSRIAIMDFGKVIAEGTEADLKSIISDTDTLFVTVENPYKVNDKELLKIPGVKNVDISENDIRVSTSRDVMNLDRIIQYFIGTHNTIKNIENRTPDLETVFLSLTGRKLRDQEA
ncbi:MAG: ABC transporter ATP-binding protein [Clostridia bacterium]|nr:ABC transporter ATP-binding protein [Clostridia bacterium]